ncbi:MAG: PEP/pyruvate-binding domain-containing protein [Candidatus Omnitrophica bacterium]|nr:PEP/pyruvate-binding domain-containing protein [Candidatus Omnitrophota bacterium]
MKNSRGKIYVMFLGLLFFFLNSLLYLDLSAGCSFRRIKTQPAKESALVLFFHELGREDIFLVGGKGANLGELSHIAGISVPEGFVVTTTAFQKFLDANPGLQDKIIRIINSIDWDTPSSINSAAEKIKEAVLRANMPREIIEMIKAGYGHLEEISGIKDVPCAVRSSGVAEDSPNFSWAGQFRTELNQRGIYQVLEAVKLIWAELYNPDALTYGHQNGIDPRKFSMGVVIQRMINSEKSGVAFGLESDTGFRANPGGMEGVFYIEGVYGLGEGMVQNIQEPDGFLVVKMPNGEFKIIERIFGSKREQIVYRSGMSGTEKTSVPEEWRQRWVFSEAEVLEIARAVFALNSHYNHPQDVEFAWEGGKLYILQSRNETVHADKPVDLIEWRKFRINLK